MKGQTEQEVLARQKKRRGGREKKLLDLIKPPGCEQEKDLSRESSKKAACFSRGKKNVEKGGPGERIC